MKFPVIRCDATIEPTSAESDSATVDLTWYAGASVRRVTWMGDEFELRFLMGEENVDLGRMKSGAPLTRDHSRRLADQVGVFEDVWMQDGKARGRVRFSDRPDVAPLVADVRAGIVRNVSMEAVIHDVMDKTPKGAAVKQYDVTRWEPMAASLVSVGADPGAQVEALAADAVTHEIKILRADGGAQMEGLNMDDQNSAAMPNGGQTAPAATAAPVAPAPVVNLEDVRQEAIVAERKRINAIRQAVATVNLGADVADQLVASGVSVEAASTRVLELMAERSAAQGVRVAVGETHDAPHDVIERMSVALAHRGGAKGVELTDGARQYRGASLVDLAAEVLTMHRIPFSKFDRPRIVELALTTSDYPNLLANASNKYLLPQYEAAQPTYRQLAMKHDLPDFKTASFLKTGDFPAPLEVPSGGEIQLGYFSESKDTGALATYGRRVVFSRAAIINDDLSAFTRVMASYGPAIANFENTAFFTLLSTVGPTLGDGGAMFNATAVTTPGGHANYTSSGTAISDTSITVGAAQMANQVGGGATNLGDGIKLNIQPRFLLANPTKRGLAFQYTSAGYVPSAPTSINPWSGILTPLLDSNVSGNRWWLFADPASAPNFAYGSLAGAPGPRVATVQGHAIEGVDMKVAFDFYVCGIDFRGGYCNAGA